MNLKEVFLTWNVVIFLYDCEHRNYLCRFVTVCHTQIKSILEKALTFPQKRRKRSTLNRTRFTGLLMTQRCLVVCSSMSRRSNDGVQVFVYSSAWAVVDRERVRLPGRQQYNAMACVDVAGSVWAVVYFDVSIPVRVMLLSITTTVAGRISYQTLGTTVPKKRSQRWHGP